MNIIILLFEGIRMALLGARFGMFSKPDGKKLAKYLESLGPIFIKFGLVPTTVTNDMPKFSPLIF